jgi:hypothetical protein
MAGSKAGVGQPQVGYIAAAGSPQQGRWRLGKLYQKFRPALVGSMNLCLTDNPNAAIITATEGENASGWSAFLAV